MKMKNWLLAAAMSAMAVSTVYAQTPLGTQPGMSPAPASNGMQGQGTNMQGQGMQGGQTMSGDETMARPKKMTHKKKRHQKKMHRSM